MKSHLLLLAFWSLFFGACSTTNTFEEDAEPPSSIKAVTLSEPPAIDHKAPPPPPGIFGGNNEEAKLKFTLPVIAKDEEVIDNQTRENKDLNAAGKPLETTQKLIRTGSVAIESNTLTESKNYVDQQLKSAGGYYEEAGFENSSSRTAYTLKTRIPAITFDAFLKTLDGAGGTLRNRSIQVSNVTTQYVDVESRLATKRTYMARYKELVQKAGKVSDLLAIEENIRTLQEKIESTESQLRILKNQVGYSTLNIELYTYKTVAIAGNSFGIQLGNAFRQSGENLKDLLLWGVENWVVLVLLFAGGLWLRQWWLRR